ncbi:MAG TPA: glycine zipper domain-containing protein [Steroidobacteraceae bacterium]|nr:glycine zipper domain-containing protein [Steroidobacteraceae bacterium]
MRTPTALACIATVAAFATVLAQSPPPVSAPTGQKTLAATLGVYAFPGAGQDSSQQSKDETECYNWAVQNTGTDPFQAAKQADQQKQQAAQQQQQTAQATQGSGARGAVRGAATGALVGEIANNDAGNGAAWGAAAGAVHGRNKSRRANEQAAQQAAQQSQAADQNAAQSIDAFKKAFGACLEAKKYTVK